MNSKENSESTTSRLSKHFDDRGVSDAVGYVIVFGIVIISVSVIFASGAGTLDDLRDDAQATNAERAMKVFSSNIDDIYNDGAPSRATELKLQSQHVHIGEKEQMNITIRNDATGNVIENETITGRPIIFETKTTSYHYTFGMLGRIDSNGQLVREQPPFQFDSQQSLLTVVQQSGNRRTIGGGTNEILITASSRQATIICTCSSRVEVEIELETTRDRAKLWKQYFEHQGLTADDSTAVDGDITYSYTTDDLVATQNEIYFNLEQ